MKKLKHSILSLLLLMGACIVSCSNDDGQTSSTDPDEVGGKVSRFLYRVCVCGTRLFWSTRKLRCIIFISIIT